MFGVIITALWWRIWINRFRSDAQLNLYLTLSHISYCAGRYKDGQLQTGRQKSILKNSPVFSSAARMCQVVTARFYCISGQRSRL